MESENIKLYSLRFELSESTEDPEVYIGKFIICDFMPNKNGVQLDREGITSWLNTLIDKPLVGKITSRIDGSNDFTSHNAKIVTKVDDFGNEYKDISFDTSAFGTFYDVGIEEIDGTEYITAYTKIWKRFEEACQIIQARSAEGTLATSWEIAVSKYRFSNYMGKQIKVIEEGYFLGHCLLGADIEPAYDSSKLLNVASTNDNNELEAALLNDIFSFEKKEVESLGKTNKVQETAETTVVANAEEKTVSALTEWDLRDKLREACKARLGNTWCWIAFHFPIDRTIWVEVEGRESELDYTVFTYEVDETDNITVSDPVNAKLTVSVSEINQKIEELNADIASKDEAIITLDETVKTLNAQIGELTPFKEKFEQAEQERIDQETAEKKQALKDKLIASNHFTEKDVEESTEIAAMIDSLDENSINRLIADKVVESVAQKTKPVKTAEVAQKTVAPVVQTSIVDGESDENEVVSHRDFIATYIGI